VLCDFFKHAPLHMSRYLNETMKLCETFLSDSNDCVKRNVAYLVGLVCESCCAHANIF